MMSQEEAERRSRATLEFCESVAALCHAHGVPAAAWVEMTAALEMYGDTSAVDHAYDILRRVHIMEVRRAAAQRGIVVDIGFSGELITETPPTETGRCPVCDGKLRPGSWLDSGDGGMEHGRMCPSCSLIWVEGWTALD